jgi:nicotinate-nucleotide adenylyltransferase
MIAAALAGRSDLCLDDRELRREGPSYTVDTLRSLAAESPGERLCLLVGDDAFAGFPDWRAPNEILGLANIAVLQRPGHTATATPGAAELLQRHGVARLDPARTGQIVTCAGHPAGDIRQRHPRTASRPDGRPISWSRPRLPN